MPSWTSMTSSALVILLFRSLGRLFRLFLIVLLDRGHRRADRRTDELFLVVARPAERLFTGDVGVVDHRVHVTHPQVVGLPGVLEIGPVVRKLQEAAELALLGLQTTDLRDSIVRGTDDNHARLDRCLDALGFAAGDVA